MAIMMRTGEYLLNQSKKIIENKRFAIMCAVAFSVLPFASWLSVALVALVTLRKGGKAGFEVLLPALVFHSVPLMMLVPLESALINTLIAYIPCYIAALGLRQTSNWQAVAGVFFLQALGAFILIQLVLPGFAVEQYTQFTKMLAPYKEYQEFIESSTQGISSFDLAHLFFGIQILSVVVSSLISLLFARMVQAKLFVPGGLSRELSEFRGNKLAVLVLIGVGLACYYELPCAIDILPLTLTYFLLAGFNLTYSVFARKWHFKMFILLFILIMIQPTLILFAYLVFGILDSLFNFRLYLPGRARESI
jgi:hypothetical protein